MKRWGLTLVAIVSLGAQLLAGTSIAEVRNAPASVDLVMLPGAITGVGSYGPVGYWRLCSPLSVGLNEWHVSFIERLLKPSDAQRELLKKLLAASLDAKKAIVQFTWRPWRSGWPDCSMHFGPFGNHTKPSMRHSITIRRRF
jgi:hypothetical protein